MTFYGDMVVQKLIWYLKLMLTVRLCLYLCHISIKLPSSHVCARYYCNNNHHHHHGNFIDQLIPRAAKGYEKRQEKLWQVNKLFRINK